MKIEQCPFCGGVCGINQIITPKVDDIEEIKKVAIGCTICGIGGVDTYTGDYEAAVKKAITKWNARVYPEDKVLDIKLKKLSIREKNLDLKRKAVDLEEVKKASASRIVEQLRVIDSIMRSTVLETEMNHTNTETLIKVTKAHSDLDVELLKNKMRLLLDRL
jgi:hypothetical protein